MYVRRRADELNRGSPAGVDGRRGIRDGKNAKCMAGPVILYDSTSRANNW